MSVSNTEYHENDEPTIHPISPSSNMETKTLSGYNVQELEEVEPTEHHLVGPPWRVALTILEQEVEIVFDIIDYIVLGRSYPHINLFEGIDLSPFNAYELGVSRKHATLILRENQVIIQDNDSNNGTLVNNKRLKPNIGYVLQNGVIIHMGRMALRFDLLFNPYE